MEKDYSQEAIYWMNQTMDLRNEVDRLKEEVAMVRKGNQVLHNNKEFFRNEAERFQRALLNIYNIDSMFMQPDGSDAEYDYKKAHDEMWEIASEALYAKEDAE